MTMEIIRNPDGSLVVPIPEGRHHDSDDVTDGATESGADEIAAPTTRVLHPGEGGYNEALAEWDLQQNPDRAPAVAKKQCTSCTRSPSHLTMTWPVPSKRSTTPKPAARHCDTCLSAERTRSRRSPKKWPRPKGESPYRRTR